MVIFILGLPGRIAIARNHPEADAVNLMGWIGFFAVVPWIQALIWAFKPTDVVDFRYLPEDVRRETEAMIARLTGEQPAPKTEQAARQGPAVMTVAILVLAISFAISGLSSSSSSC